VNGGRWNKLGTFTLDRDSKVVLSNTANGTVIADAVTLLPAGTTPKPLAEGDTASWSLTTLEPGEYDIYASWPQGPRHATDARYRIYPHKALTKSRSTSKLGGMHGIHWEATD
jgi:hypothetical protein